MTDELSEDEILALQIREDNKLRRIGIDPDGDPIAIMVELERRRVLMDAEDAARQRRNRKPE